MMRPPAPTGVTHAENSQHAIHAGASRVTRNQRIVVIAQGLRLLLFVLATVLLGRWLEPAAFGFVGLISGLFLAAQEILDMGTTAVTTRQVAQQPSDERDLLNALMTWRCLLSLVLAAGVTLWGCWGPVQQAEQRWVLFSAAVVLLFMPWSSYHVVFQTRQAFGRASTLALATQSTFLISGIALLKTPFLAWATAISAGGAMGLAVITREWLQLWGSRWQATQLLGYRLRASWSSPGLRPLLRKAWLFGLAGVSYKLSALTGVFFLWTWREPHELGTFSAAQRLFAPLTDTAWMFTTPLIAAMSWMVQHHHATFRLQLNALTRWLIALSCSMAVGGHFVGPWILGFLYGDTYTQGTASAVPVFQWLSIGLGFALVTPVLAVACLAQGQDALLMRISLIGLSLNIAANLWWVPQLGSQAAAMAWCLSEAWVMSALLIAAIHQGHLHIRPRDGLYLLPSIAMLIVLPQLTPWPTMQFLVGCLIGLSGLIVLHQQPAQRAVRQAVAATAQTDPAERTSSTSP
ncbi:polysaccharide biosynthesis C-terminal domain-containing protein [Ottowia thiooxydans]|uniref:oligosaccharide flippase family protein n=1 Tax=Ottowia thiooxydans TaxID=219182 RepID=UPI0004265C8F|nr:polysaccharide biosynthesis C-terminal domain-containing protein [Ottowia thiooxydans]